MAAARPGQDLRAHWQAWAARFAALQPRERILVVGAVLFLVLFGGYSLWIEPAQLQKTRLQKTIDQQQTEQKQLADQIAALAAQSRDPDAANRATLAQLEKQLGETDRDIRSFDRVLVAPAQAPALLQTLLGRHRGLALVSLTTMPPQPLVAPPAQEKPDAHNGAKQEAAVAPPGGNIYKHGIEIRIAGSYQDLLAYVSDLESGPQKLLWGGMRLAVQKYPVSELTLTVYTLSLDSTWLVV